MRILVNIDELGPLGGVEQHVFQTSKELGRRGHQINLIYRRDAGFGAEARSTFSSVTPVPSFDVDPRHPLTSGRQLWPALRAGIRSRPDVIYVNRFADLPWAVVIAALTRASVVCHLHFFRAHRATRLRAIGASRFVAVSHALAEQWVGAGIDSRRISVAPNGIEPDVFAPGDATDRCRAREALGISKDAFVALYCGRFHTEKGVDVLLDAWRRLDFSGDEGHLVLVGSPGSVPGSGEYHRQLIERGDVGCTWLPARSDVATPMRAADVVVVPSRSESFGRVAIEAMATGRPVVASRVGGLPEVLSGDFARFLVPPDDPAMLAEVLRSLVGWQRREPDLAAACTAHVRTHFTLTHSVDLIEGVMVDARGRR